MLMAKKILTRLDTSFDFKDGRAMPSMVTPQPGHYPYIYVCGSCNKDIFGSNEFLPESKFVCGHCGAGLVVPKEPI